MLPTRHGGVEPMCVQPFCSTVGLSSRSPTNEHFGDQVYDVSFLARQGAACVISATRLSGCY